MKRPACLRAGGLASRRAVGLTEGERLVLEEHVAACSACRRDLAALELVVHAIDSHAATPLADRERAIAHALAASTDDIAAARPRSFARLPFVAAAVMATVVSVWYVSRDRHEPAVSRDVALVIPDAAEVGATAVAGDDAAIAPEIDVLVPGKEHVVDGAADVVVTAGPARLTLTPGTRVTWDQDAAMLSLHAGSVSGEVTPARHQVFRVAAARFVVEVTGARFHVDLQRVRVDDGDVRVLAPDGKRLLRLVRDGETWRPADAPQTTARERLRRARALLARRDLVRARAEIEGVIASAPAPRDHADALNLRAECALVEGDRDAAIALYLQVAEQFQRLSAGENALFAAARLQLRGGQRALAGTLLRRYLTRYPRGQFVREAAGHLSKLEEAP